MKQLPAELEREDRRFSLPGMRSCCCCLTPKRGTVLLAILHLLKHGAGVVFCCLMLLNTTVHNKVTEWLFLAQKRVSQYPNTMDYNYAWDSTNTMTYDQFDEKFTFMSKVGLGLASLLVIIALFVIHGVANRKPGFLLPFYVYGIFDIGFTIFWIFQYCTYSVSKYEFMGLCGLIIILFVKIYFMGCVWAAYQQIRREINGTPIAVTLGMEKLPPKYEEIMRNGDLPPAYVP
eukprot:m.189827 g.189827  ORF g.189827 m.189827 type:complete len:232 (+) comp39423_c1_seq21:163-858(+)